MTTFTTPTGMVLPKLAMTHWFPPYPTRLNMQAPGVANTSVGVVTTLGYTIPATTPGGDAWWDLNFTNPTWTSSSYNTFGGMSRNAPPKERRRVYSSTALSNVSIQLTGKTVPQWRLNDAIQEVADIAAAGYNAIALEMLAFNGATTNYYSNFSGGLTDTWDRCVLMCEAVKRFNAATGASIVVIPQPDLGGPTSSVSGSPTSTVTSTDVANAVTTLAQYSCVMRVTVGGVPKVVVMPYRPENGSVTYWQSVVTTSAGASNNTPVVLLPMFGDVGTYSPGWISAGLAFGLSHWGSRNPQANASGGTAPYISSAASGTTAGIWVQPTSGQDQRPRSKKYSECAGWGNLLACWQLASEGAGWVLTPTWNDYSEGTEFAPSDARGAILAADVAGFGVIDKGYGERISVPSLLNLRYVRRFLNGDSIPSDNTVWVCNRAHSWKVRPSWSGYTVTEPLPAGPNITIEQDSTMKRDLTVTGTGSSTTYNVNATGGTLSLDIVDVLTYFDAATNVTCTVGGTSLTAVTLTAAGATTSTGLTTVPVSTGQQRTVFLIPDGVVGAVVVTATRGAQSATVNGKTIISNPVSQDMQYWPSFTQADFSPVPTGTIPVMGSLDLGGVNTVVNMRSSSAATDAATRGDVAAMITTALSGLSTGNPADVQVFTTPGTATWTKPSGATYVRVDVVAGGGGGGSGRRGAAASIRAGGGGGGAGGYTTAGFAASALGSTETVTVAAGGTGGTSKTTDSTNGSAGANGGTSSFGVWIKATGGVGGGGGTATGGASGSGATSWPNVTGFNGGSGTAGDSTGLAGTNASATLWAPGGGAGGGGITSADAANAGGTGAPVGIATSGGAGQVLAGGASGTSGAAGGAGASAGTNVAMGGSGGGGGAASTTGAAGAGGAGGKYGSGGGGGGASLNATGASGAGGAGADGIVIVTTWR